MNMFKSRQEKNLEEFLKLIPKLEPVEFVGLAKMFGVDLLNLDETIYEGEKEYHPPRDAEDIFEDMLDKFTSLRKQRQGEILGIMRDITREAKANGTTA